MKNHRDGEYIVIFMTTLHIILKDSFSLNCEIMKVNTIVLSCEVDVYLLSFLSCSDRYSHSFSLLLESFP